MKEKSKVKSQKSKILGFTLIELLVVIAIISVLAGLLMANFVGVRQRGRDAQRKSELRQIQAALELYRSDNSSYPIVLPNCESPLMDPGGTVTYMQEIPCDPLDGGTVPYATSGTYTSDGITYSIYACLENENDSDRDNTPAGACTASITYNNP